jgi:hypothetical protein
LLSLCSFFILLRVHFTIRLSSATDCKTSWSTSGFQLASVNLQLINDPFNAIEPNFRVGMKERWCAPHIKTTGSTSPQTYGVRPADCTSNCKIEAFFWLAPPAWANKGHWLALAPRRQSELPNRSPLSVPRNRQLSVSQSATECLTIGNWVSHNRQLSVRKLEDQYVKKNLLRYIVTVRETVEVSIKELCETESQSKIHVSSACCKSVPNSWTTH